MKEKMTKEWDPSVTVVPTQNRAQSSFCLWISVHLVGALLTRPLPFNDGYVFTIIGGLFLPSIAFLQNVHTHLEAVRETLVDSFLELDGILL